MVDPWMFGRVKPRRPDTKIDAITFPSMKPYEPPDHGFGHEGYPALSLTAEAATRFCNWLHDQTDLRFRLPTEAEWEYAARCGGAPLAGLMAEQLDVIAWTNENSDEQTHPVGKKRPNGWGLYDMLGNVGEWVRVEPDGESCLKGGHYRSKTENVNSSARRYETPRWKLRDPQEPKSKVWFSDGPFVGFLVVCGDDPPTTRPGGR